ncbi:hypothetical protein LGT39_14165 [Demequina sp. TTPB684]|uniref:hypothetical protein n=1 Tax=unclassified Demequina TaxID=2620311 RepID=UPI001CF3944D|nr:MULTISPECIES: hypothetical protein [unclassified Demequina]MCB2413992.1 hypothetical protein [Demequina sp. TTPB684]UPU88656.1 hypothetical protein LGT36_001665 [Demequina sp. TMPB413]
MTLRTTAIIAGALGLLMLIAGLIAQAVRPEQAVVTQATLGTPVVVLGPEVLALPGLQRLAVTSDGAIEAHTARPVDAQAWLGDHSATFVTGYASWDEFTTRTASRIVPESPSPTPTASADAEAAASPSPTPTPSPEATPVPEDAADDADEVVFDYGSGDVWRQNWAGEGRVSVALSAVAPGESFVVTSVDGSDLATLEVSALREVNDAWISPLIWIGAALAALGVLAVLSAIIDVRPLQERVESWTTSRSRTAPTDSVRPGSRRERRLAGSTLPDVDLEEKEDRP